ncbi:MAG TPA: hypothetical protein VK857_06510, partial [Desulforhopalus sp.]|nr:hypothetical protein [Desulforhopalus sp.]
DLFTKLCVMLKFLSVEYQIFACGKILRMPSFWTKIYVLQKALVSNAPNFVRALIATHLLVIYPQH